MHTLHCEIEVGCSLWGWLVGQPAPEVFRCLLYVYLRYTIL